MGLYDKRWPGEFIELTDVRHPDHGGIGDGVVDDTAAVQHLIDSFGDENTFGIGDPKLHGAHRITSTLEVTRKALNFLGSGPGSSLLGQGAVLKWDGAAGSPMIRFNQCIFAGMKDVRFAGKTTAKPSAAIEIQSATGDAPTNTQLAFKRIWIGAATFDTDQGNQFTSGIVTSGINVQSDQSSFDHIFVQGVDAFCIRLVNTQNVLMKLSNLVLNGGAGAKGLSSAARHIIVHNAFFQTNDVDIELTDDASIDVFNMGSEISVRLLLAAAGARASFYGGYWQSSSSTHADDNVIDVSGSGTSVVRLQDFAFSRGASYAGTGETIKMRGPGAVLIASNVGLATGHTPALAIDMATTTAGDKRRIEWQGQVTGNFANQWVHGETGMPDFQSTRIDSSQRGVTFLTLADGLNNNLAIGNCQTVRATAHANGSTITGIAGGAPNRAVRFINSGTNNLALGHQHASSDAGNRILSPTGATMVVGVNGAFEVEYDDSSSTLRWRIVNAIGVL